MAEDRADYYARVVAATDFDVNRLEHFLRSANESDEYSTQMALPTLGVLAEKGDSRAVLLLEDYLGYGYYWEDAARYLASTPDPALWRRVEPALHSRCREDCADLWAEETEREPWASWRAYIPELDQQLRELEAPVDTRCMARRERLAPLGLGELIEEAIAREPLALGIARDKVRPGDEPWLLSQLNSSRPHRKAILIHLLAKLESAGLGVRMKSLWLQSQAGPPRLKVAVRSAVRKLPGETLRDWAREWAGETDRERRNIAGLILHYHGERRDVPALRELLRASVSEGDCALGFCVEAFVRTPAVEAVPEIEAVFQANTDSYIRRWAAEALAASDKTFFRDTYARECLFDCENKTRSLAKRVIGKAA